jgi:hypothetical protein
LLDEKQDSNLKSLNLTKCRDVHFRSKIGLFLSFLEIEALKSPKEEVFPKLLLISSASCKIGRTQRRQKYKGRMVKKD